MESIAQESPGIFQPPEVAPLCRREALGAVSPAMRVRLDQLLDLSKRGLPQMHRHGSFAHTVRAVKIIDGMEVRPEGDSLRYAINVALGLSCLDVEEQRAILSGRTALDLVNGTVARAETSEDPGAIALAAWTAAEAADIYAGTLISRLTALLRSGQPIATVDCAWTLLAAVGARNLGDTAELTRLARDRLLQAQAESGLFPHRLPASSLGRLRAHIGCFADQVYAIQGLSRLFVAENDRAALGAAEACAARICELQGDAGQWWWHYDIRDGSVVEGYPVYSVHQHAMGPMALLDLREAGGSDYMDAMIKGLSWLDRHPEVSETMVDETHNVIWRKVARRESKKAVRAISAATTALRRGLRAPGLDTMFPPNQIDYECRPYELGWMLYGWLGGGAVEQLRNRPAVGAS
ncbi:hypothetical protein [Oryzicola mucosus]|nr:hypothetical protein [Oryzicola mucosus]